MIANSRCIACNLSKKEEKIRKHLDEKKKKEFIQKVTGILYKYGDIESTPMLDKRIQDIYNEYYEEETDYIALKHKYNQYMLEREDEIKEHLKEAKDIKDYIKYVCVGNYIDFGVTGNIDDQMLDDLLKKVDSLNIPEQEIKYLEEELKQAKTLLYITDNCGEIVLDKIFIEELKKRYGNLEITVMVRGGLAINDATIEDAQEIGLTKIVPVISNGAAIAGTVKEQLSKEARKQLDSADVIIAKGMGNFDPGLAEGEATHQETGDHGQQGPQHGDQVLTQHGLLRPALVVVGHDPQAAGKAGDHGPGGENGGAPAHFLGDKVDAGGGQQAENPQPGPGNAHRPLSQQGTGAAGPGGQGQKAADGQENRPGQGAGEQRGGVRRESAGVALVELAVLAPAQNQQRGRHRRRDKDHGPQTGGAGDGQAGARLKPMGQINPPNQQTDQAAGHGHAGQDDRFPHEKGLPSVKRREGTHSRA